VRRGGADTEEPVEEPVDPAGRPDPDPMPPLDEPAEPGGGRNPVLTAVALLAAAAFVLIGIGLPLVGHGSFSGADLLLAREPWKSTAPTGYSAQIASVSDTIDSVLATHHFYKEQIDAGNVPVWNPLAAGGSPLGTGISYAVFTPVNLPYLILPTWLAPAWSKLLELAVAIAGSFLFLRRLRMTRPAALVGGVLFASSGFMVTWTNWPQTQVAAFIPALFWAAERFAQRRDARSAVPIALVVGALLLGGFPAVTGYALYAAAPYLVLRLLQLTGRDPLRLLAALVKAGVALGLGVGLVAISLLPFLSTLNQLDYLEARAQTPDIKLSPLMLLTTGVWRAFGTVTGDGYWGPSTQIEGLSFIGAGALVLIGFGVLRRPAEVIPSGVRVYFIVATALTVVLGYVGGPVLELAQKFPVFSNNPVYRIRSVLGFFLAVLAAYGYDALVRTARRRVEEGKAPLRESVRLRAGIEAVGWGVAAVLAVLAAQRLFGIGASVGKLPYVHRQVFWAAVPAAAVFAAGMVATALRRRSADGARGAGALHTGALALIPLVVVAESLSLVLAFWPRIPRSDFYPETQAHVFLQDNLGHERYAAKDLTLFTGTNTYYGLRNTTGHSFTEPEWKELLLTADPKSFASPTFSTFSRNITPAVVRSPLLDLMSVKYFAMAPSDPVIGTASTAGPAGTGGELRPGATVRVPLGRGPLRGVGPVVGAATRPADPFASLQVRVTDAAGTTLASSSRRLYASVRPGPFVVPVAGDGLPTDRPLFAELTLRSDAPLPVAGSDARPQVQLVRPAAGDGLRLRFTDGAAIYERTTVYPRFRWADHTQVIADKTRRLTVLANIRDPGRVVLDSPGPAADGKPATVDVRTDGTDGSTVEVDATGAGYLVVADAEQTGWQATVDGRPVDLVKADHALVAVPVPTGRHEVALHATVPGRSRGTVVSAASVVGLGLMVAAPPLWRRRRPGVTDPD
jgi:Bacterial membrane protein YfhO